MITQIEIDGFKTFKDFKVELAPFQVIVGANGSGKSNLFDALHLLSRLAEFDLRTAFQGMRGSADAMFTMLPDGKYSDHIQIAVEMLVDRNIQDSLGVKTTLVYTRLRYELEITQHTDEYGLDQLHVTHETLKSISPDEDTWSKKYGLSSENGWLSKPIEEQATFISTGQATTAISGSIANGTPTLMLQLHREGQETRRSFRAQDVQRSILSSVTNAEYPHVFAAREEMRSVRFLHLNHEALHQPSPVNAPAFLARDGSNLPTMIARMQREDPFFINDIARDLANLVPDVVGVEIKKHPIRNEYTIWVQYEDGRSFPSQVLSDGTLRLLVLATLYNDPEFHGVLCFEEPENGINPSYLKDAAHLLRQLATDFNEPRRADEPLRQVLITTHSPTLISQPDAIDRVLFVYRTLGVEPFSSSIPSMHTTQAVPVPVSSNTDAGPEVDKKGKSYTIDRVKELLTNDFLTEALESLDKSRAILNER